MYFSNAAARSRNKWIVSCLLIFVLFYISYQSTLVLNDQPSEERLIFVEVETVSTPKPMYYVESEHCKIPYIDPFSAEAMEVYEPRIFQTCSNQSDLVQAIFNNTSKRYILYINESVAAELLNSTDIEFNCFYQEVIREVEHDSYQL